MLVGRAMSSSQHKTHYETTIFGELCITCVTPMETSPSSLKTVLQPVPVSFHHFPSTNKEVNEDDENNRKQIEKFKATHLVEELLEDIYNNNLMRNHDSNASYRKNSRSSDSCKSFVIEVNQLHKKDKPELVHLVRYLERHVSRAGTQLLRELKRRDALRRQQDAHCDVITGQLQKRSSLESDEMCFSIQPAPGESGFSQWVTAMKMVAQLPGGIPPDFRKRLWIILAERHLVQKRIDWNCVEKNCFSEWSHPADSELGVQIVKDLHRTGCSLFCGADGQENQALLKKVLLAYARWNKAVGYCQGFNMLAALILQVTDKCESDALKVMIYLIEGVLPDSYFADSLRGLSVDMAVFRELLRTRLPRLSKHLDALQNAAKDGTTSYEPPLTNVFTMQWFLTLFSNCLPQPTVLRVWDLILLEGNEILLRTALAIWQNLADKIMTVRTADEFYCMMGLLTRDLLEFNLIDANSLIKSVVAIGALTELKSLREHYLYNINPWGAPLPSPSNTERQLKIYPKENLVLDISALKKQYAKLKQRQRQAHIIFNAAITRQPPPSAPVAMNHLLLGKSALVPAKRLGPPKGSIPPARLPPSTLHWKDAPNMKNSDSSSSSDTELCDDPSESSSSSPSPIQEPISSQLLDNDNLTCKPNDNILPIETKVEIEESVNQKQLLPSKVEDFMFNDPESDNDSEDFEHFLKDRVRCFKEINEESSTSGNYSRRNSERALQIIQENSLILHRILQCQSRLSPPPPIVEANNSANSNATSLILEDKSSVKQEDKSPEYGSRYTKILEKSKNLDERYNSLILNASPVSNFKKISSFSYSEDNKSDLNSKEDNYSSEFSIKSWDYDNKSASQADDDNKLIDFDTDYDRNFMDFLKEEPEESDVMKEDDVNVKSFQVTPTSPMNSNKSTELKSPNKIFNPFPVALNSRQSKEVPLKLGLYKK